MNTTRLQLTRHFIKYARFTNNLQNLQEFAPKSCFYSTFTLDAFTSEIFERQRRKKFQRNDHTELSLQHCTDTNAKNNVSTMSSNELDNTLSELLSKNKDKHIEDIVIKCQDHRKFLSLDSIKKLFRHYSVNGKPEMVVVLQTYCIKVDPNLYKRNGEFLHYLAKAQCMKGNSEKGLTILRSCYLKYDSLKSFYRIIFRELIQDSVLNRSEASLVIFKQHVLNFSNTLSDHYPLVCLWHICWTSSWFSDQMLANELLESSESLQDIVKDKATAFSIMALKDFNVDAVVRLLQTLLKYDMMMQYVAVLQVLFNYKLKNRDIRGCTEIVRNCEALGVKLPSDQQGRYIKMLIVGQKRTTNEPTTKTPLKDFKFKF